MRRFLAAVAVVVLLGGCGSGDSGPSASEGLSGDGAPIEPTGLTLVGSSGWGSSAVVDGTGMVWIDGPMQLTRLDPRTGKATTWDAADDLTFATITEMAPSDGAGVWLVGGGRVRRFDGDGFVSDVTVPEEYLEPSGRIGSLVEDGETLWVTVDDGEDHVVARVEQGSWTRLPDGHGDPIAVDSDGTLWAVERRAGGEPVGLSRFDGTTWSRPDSSVTYPTGRISSIVADPGGGVWVLAHLSPDAAASLPPSQDGRTLVRFDGSSWSQTPVRGAIGEIPSWRGMLAVAPDGGVWVAGMSGVARYDPDGQWRTFGAADGLPAEPREELRSVVVAGDEVVVVSSVGAQRFDGTQFVPLWSDPASVQRLPGPLVAVSRDEVWARAGDGGWWRHRNGAWEPVGPQEDATEAMGFESGVVASDGAVWVPTPVGLVRVDGDDWTVMSERDTSRQQLAAGPDGSVWAIEGGSVVRLDADGSRTPLDYQPGFSPERLAVGPDGTLWAAGGWHWSAGRTERWSLARWDGTWQEVPSPPWMVQPYPEGWSWTGPVSGLVVAADGALWVSGYGPGFVARYANGEWTNFEDDSEPVVEHLVALPNGTVCAAPDLTCFDATGRIASTITETLPGVFFDDIGVAPDGAVWVHGEQIARLPDGALQ